MDYTKIREDNLKRLLNIRDDDETSPAVQIQAIQSIQKLLAEIEPATDSTKKPTGKDLMAKIRGDKA